MRKTCNTHTSQGKPKLKFHNMNSVGEPIAVMYRRKDQQVTSHDSQLIQVTRLKYYQVILVIDFLSLSHCVLFVTLVDHSS